jgi:hypothetical protein
MNTWERLIVLGGILHFALLSAGAMVPFKLDFRGELKKVNSMLRELVWVYYVFIAFSIVGFGVLSVTMASALASGSTLARAVCGFISLFWITRLAIQLFVFHAKDHLTNWFFRTGYHALTLVFCYHAVIYGLVALRT